MLNILSKVELENKNLENKIKELKTAVDESLETQRENKTKDMNEILSLQEQILKYKTSENKIKEELLNMEHEKLEKKVQEFLEEFKLDFIERIKKKEQLKHISKEKQKLNSA